ncbi:MAG: hypothetical protein JJU11_01875 [Candidatus Sumerlaeia bacterium]|nr:hypothetical protein [Candidatus Sumerlaeia bacterium]
MSKTSFPAKLSIASILATGLLVSGAYAQTTHVIGTGSGTDFDTIAAAIADASVVAGDTLLLDEANNGNAPFVQGGISKAVTIVGENNPEVRGPGNWFFTANGEVIVRDLTVTGTEGPNGIVVNDANTVLTLDNVTVSNKPQWGVNVNTGTLNITNGSQIINNGWAGVSVGGGSSTEVNIIGTSDTPIVISGNGAAGGAGTPVQRAALSSRLLEVASDTLTWNVTHVNISGSDFGYINQGSFPNPDESINPGNQIAETTTFTSVNFSDIAESAIRLNGDNVTFEYNGGTIAGRTDADADIMDNINLPLINITDSTTGDGNNFTASNLNFPGDDVPARLRNDSNPITVTDSTFVNGTQGLSVSYVGGGGATFIDCSFTANNQAIMQGVGGTAPVTLTDPVLAGTAGIAFYMQGHTGEFTIQGTDPENKVSLDGITVPGTLIRNWAGTTTLVNVEGSTINALFDTNDLGPHAGPVVLNLDQCYFVNQAGTVTMSTNATESFSQPATINATNTMWIGESNQGWILSVLDDNRDVATPGTVNLTHCTIAPTSVAALLINGNNGVDTINSDFSIFDASGGGTLLASGVPLTGEGNLSYSENGATASGGWVNGFPGDTIIADPLLAPNGELTAPSFAVDNAVGSTTPVDYVGNTRPNGNNADIGAHESAFTNVSDWMTFTN